MREISVLEIIEKVAEKCIEANCVLNTDIIEGLGQSLQSEKNPSGRDILSEMLENAKIAREDNIAICQDTGMVIAFVTIGQDIHIIDGNISDAINQGVAKGYEEGFLRKSVVGDPLLRVNTGDNTPAIIYYDIVPGDKLVIDIVPKGFGSENMGGVAMLKPSQGIEGVYNAVIDIVEKAGPNPCPPIVVGVGIGGTMDKATLLSKRALLRPLNSISDKEHIAELEKRLFNGINDLGIGPAGLGGTSTTLGVNIETYPTHIAGLPVAVTISCHVTRHTTLEI